MQALLHLLKAIFINQYGGVLGIGRAIRIVYRKSAKYEAYAEELPKALRSLMRRDKLGRVMLYAVMSFVAGVILLIKIITAIFSGRAKLFLTLVWAVAFLVCLAVVNLAMDDLYVLLYQADGLARHKQDLYEKKLERRRKAAEARAAAADRQRSAEAGAENRSTRSAAGPSKLMPPPHLASRRSPSGNNTQTQDGFLPVDTSSIVVSPHN